MRLLLAATVLAAAAGSAVPAAAQQRLSDALSPRQRVNAQLDWTERFPRRGMHPDKLNAMTASAPGVELRLDTAAVQGRRARVFLVLPLDIGGLRSPNGLRMEWKGRGRFLDGSAIPGQRTLLFEGDINAPVLQGFLDITLHLDARDVTLPFTCEPVYEIELL